LEQPRVGRRQRLAAASGKATIFWRCANDGALVQMAQNRRRYRDDSRHDAQKTSRERRSGE